MRGASVVGCRLDLKHIAPNAEDVGLPYEQLTAVIPNKKQVDWLTEMRDRREEEERDQWERERELHASLPKEVEPS